MAKDFSLRASPQLYRELHAFHGESNYEPGRTISSAVDVTPEAYLERKPRLLHVQLSDSAEKKLNKVAKKTGLSKAALIERAFDYAYRKSVMEQAKKIAADIDEIVASKESPFHATLSGTLPDLITMLMPFQTTFGGRKEQRWSLLPYKAVGTEAASHVEEVGFA